MRGYGKRVIALIAAVLLLSFSLPFCVAQETEHHTLNIASLKGMFPQGMYWNGGDPQGYTPFPCDHSAAPACNSYGKWGTQCVGFAYQLAHTIYGDDPAYDWDSTSDPSAVDDLKPGDIVRYRNNGHSVFITGVNGNNVTVADCNYYGKCEIRWDVVVSKSTLKSTFTYARIAPYPWDTGLYDRFSEGTYQITAPLGVHLTAVPGGGENLRVVPCDATVNISRVSDNWGYTVYEGTAGWIPLEQTTCIHTHLYTKKTVEQHPHRVSYLCTDYLTCRGYLILKDSSLVRDCKHCWYFKGEPDRQRIVVVKDTTVTVNLNIEYLAPPNVSFETTYDRNVISCGMRDGYATFYGRELGETQYKISMYRDAQSRILIGECSVTVTVIGEENLMKCDADFNGRIGVTDAVAIFKHISGKEPFTKTHARICDADGDGGVTVSDALAVFKHMAGVELIDLRYWNSRRQRLYGFFGFGNVFPL